MPFKRRAFTALLTCIFTTSCGLRENPTECYDHPKAKITGQLEQDILGVWVGCLVYTDTVGPICVFEPNGVLKLVYGIPSKENREAAPDLYETTGVIKTHSYVIEGDLASGNNRVSSPDGGFEWTITDINKHALSVENGFVEWRHQECAGYGFD